MSKNRTTEFWMHGWGLGDFFFAPLQKSSQEEVTLGNQGYFDSKSMPADPPKRLLAHSLGLHLVPQPWFAQVEELILLGSFLSFHSPSVPRSERAVKRMISKFEKEPQQVLEEFYCNCFYPQETPIRPQVNFKAGLILEDLHLLDQQRLDPALLQSIPRILILQGEEDVIVPTERAKDLQSHLPQAQMKILQGAGHGFPYSHAVETWEAIQAWRKND